jgi:hypothetical protein
VEALPLRLEKKAPLETPHLNELAEMGGVLLAMGSSLESQTICRHLQGEDDQQECGLWSECE